MENSVDEFEEASESGANENPVDKTAMSESDSFPIVTANSIVELLNSPVKKTYSTSSMLMDASPSTSCNNSAGAVTTMSNSTNSRNANFGSNGPKSDDSKTATKFEQQKNNAEPFICAGCNNKILDRYLLEAEKKLWHEDCLKCDACGCRLAEVGKSFYVKNNKLFCRRDYARLFLAKGKCSACNNVIPACELVMRASANVYHLECFGCQECNYRFTVGDRFYFDVDNNKILCEYDYNERMCFAQLAQTNFGFNSLAMLKRQLSQVDDFDEVQPVPR